MKTNNLDRFSRPFYHEGVGIDLAEIERQNELNKRDMVDSFISRYWDDYEVVPAAEFIQEQLHHIDLDLDMIEERLRVF